MPSQELLRIIRDLSQFGDTISIKAAKSSIQFSTNGSVGSGNIKLSQTSSEAEDKKVSLDISDPVDLQFACRYLNLFMKAASLSPRVTLSMSTDIPLKVEFNVGKIGNLRYYLAPKIEDD